MYTHRLCRNIFISTAILFLLATQAHAVTILWASPGTNLWNINTNWNPATVPTTFDLARINNAGTALIDGSVSAVPNLLELGSATGTTGSVVMTGGTLTTTSSDIRVGGNATTGGGSGNFTQSGGAIFLGGGNFNSGQGATGVGTYNLSGGSFQVNIGTLFVVGNRGTGLINQSGGTIYVRGGATPGVSAVQLGRNATTGTGFGTYNLSGGKVAAAQLLFGQAVGIAGSSNTFNLQGAGVLLSSNISIINTAAINTFNFTGGTLTANTIAISLTNNGGIFSPGTATFNGATDISLIPFNAIGTTTFSAGKNYLQTSGTLAVDLLDGSGSGTGNDYVSLDAASSANISGTISVNLLRSFFDPAIGSTFDILTAGTVQNNAVVTGATSSGRLFQASVVTGGNGQLLRLTVVAGPPLVNTQTFNAYNDFDTNGVNPKGAWSYGQMPTGFGAFEIFTNFDANPSTPFWSNGSLPAVWKVVVGPYFSVESGLLAMHPGSVFEPAVVRWVAPVSGTVQVQGEFFAGDSGAPTVGVRLRNSPWWSATDAGAFNLQTNVVAGDAIDFVVYDQYVSCTTGLGALITLNPTNVVTGVKLTMNGTKPNYVITVAGGNGGTYVLQHAASLTTPITWVDIKTNQSPTTALFSFTDYSNTPAGFYRVRTGQ